MSSLAGSPSGGEADSSDHGTFVLHLMPEISSVGHADLGQGDLAAAVEIGREVVLVVDSNIHLICSILNFEGSLLVPLWLLATAVDCLRLELLSVNLEDGERILVAEGVKVAIEFSLDDLQFESATCCFILSLTIWLCLFLRFLILFTDINLFFRFLFLFTEINLLDRLLDGTKVEWFAGCLFMLGARGSFSIFVLLHLLG